MTAAEFNNLKVGDSVYLPNSFKKGTYISTEILEIDRVYKKIKVLLRSKFLSYKYFPKKVDHSKCSLMVGTIKDWVY